MSALILLASIVKAPERMYTLPPLPTPLGLLTSRFELPLMLTAPKLVTVRACVLRGSTGTSPEPGALATWIVPTPSSAHQRTGPNAAAASRDAFQKQLSTAGVGAITTEIVPAPEFYYAEDYHQQYLAKNPDGYCGLGGTGVTCPIGISVTA